MPHSFNKIWIFAIWSTKERLLLIHPTVETKNHQFIAEQLREQGCLVRIINGMPDHIHCLFLLSLISKLISISKLIVKSTKSCL